MSITINGVKPGTATLTIRAGTQSVDAPVTVRENLRRWLPMPATMFGVRLRIGDSGRSRAARRLVWPELV